MQKRNRLNFNIFLIISLIIVSTLYVINDTTKVYSTIIIQIYFVVFISIFLIRVFREKRMNMTFKKYEALKKFDEIELFLDKYLKKCILTSSKDSVYVLKMFLYLEKDDIFEAKKMAEKIQVKYLYIKNFYLIVIYFIENNHDMLSKLFILNESLELKLNRKERQIYKDNIEIVYLLEDGKIKKTSDFHDKLKFTKYPLFKRILE